MLKKGNALLPATRTFQYMVISVGLQQVVQIVMYISDDKGYSWESYKTPIIQGQETTGIYSIDFYNDSLGYAIGGDYTKPLDNSKQN